MTRSRAARAILALALFTGPEIAPAAESPGRGGQEPELDWEVFDSGTTASFRGLAAVSHEVIWASGANGTWRRSTDGGATWSGGQVPGAETAGIRDVHAFDADRALLLTIGAPGRVYATDDGGTTWRLVFEDARPGVFFNCMDFADGLRGYAVGDIVDGRFLFIETHDGGATWAAAGDTLPPPLAGEGQFAASGTCLQATGDAIWVATAVHARILRSADRGDTWQATSTPLQQDAPSKGAFGIYFWNLAEGIVVGGDYSQEGNAYASLARTDDGGATWATDPDWWPGGFRSAVTSPDGGATLIAVGPSGSSLSADHGHAWQALRGPGFHTVSAAPDGAVWAAGALGRIARLRRP